MTISKAISEFLGMYQDLKIDTDHVSDGSDKYGLFRSPGRDKKEYTDGSYVITEHYQFFARQASLSDTERMENDEWLEDLTYWVDDYPLRYDYPALDKGRRILDISVTGTPCPMETGDQDTLYEIALSVKYVREREEF